MGGGDRINKMRELFVDVYAKASAVVVNAKAQAQYDEPLDVLEAIKAGATSWEKIEELGKVISGHDAGRTDDKDITLHRHHTGLGLWYTSAGQRLYEAAVKAKAGRELPEELFYQTYMT